MRRGAMGEYILGPAPGKFTLRTDEGGSPRICHAELWGEHRCHPPHAAWPNFQVRCRPGRGLAWDLAIRFHRIAPRRWHRSSSESELSGAVSPANLWATARRALGPFPHPPEGPRLPDVPEPGVPSFSWESSRPTGGARARARSRLTHPNIVHYLGHSFTDDSLLIFLEYVPGGPPRAAGGSASP